MGRVEVGVLVQCQVGPDVIDNLVRDQTWRPEDIITLDEDGYFEVNDYI